MKIRAQILALLGLIAVGFIVLPQFVDAQQTVKRDVKKARQLRTEADKLYRQKNFREAINKYAESITFDPANAEAHFWKGSAHQELQEYDAAVADLTKALELKYKPLEVYKVRGYANYQKKDYAAANADIREILKLEPNNVNYLRTSADISYELKSYDEALAAYQKLSAANPNDGNLYYRIALIHNAMGNTQGQADAADNAIKRNTQFLADALLLAGDAHLKLGRAQEAETAFLKALSSKPDNRQIYLTLADLYRQQSRFTEAVDILRRAIRLYPNDGGLYTEISWYYSLAGRHQDAVDSAQAGIRFLPNQSLAYTNLCRAYNDMEKPELAVTACNNALKYKADDGETNFYLGRAYDLMNKPAEATKHYKRAVTGLETFTQNSPNSSDGFYLLGNAYFADNQTEKAIAAYNKSIELSPRFARARYNVGMVQLQNKNKAAATEQYNVLIGLDRTLATKLKIEIDKAPDN